MSVVLSSTKGVKARKPHQCDLCFEMIEKGSIYDKRTGAGDGQMWTMHMHPECHKYEQSPERPVDPDWYECIDSEAFDRKDAIAYAARQPLADDGRKGAQTNL
jgi:hypothetical protein